MWISWYLFVNELFLVRLIFIAEGSIILCPERVTEKVGEVLLSSPGNTTEIVFFPLGERMSTVRSSSPRVINPFESTVAKRKRHVLKTCDFIIVVPPIMILA